MPYIGHVGSRKVFYFMDEKFHVFHVRRVLALKVRPLVPLPLMNNFYVSSVGNIVGQLHCASGIELVV